MQTIEVFNFNDVPECFTGKVQMYDKVLDTSDPHQQVKHVKGPCNSIWWLKKGIVHNDDGPAKITADGHKEYWIEDEEVELETFELLYMLKYRKVYQDNYGTL